MGTASQATPAARLLQRRALTFVVLMGLVSLCADMVYEGARSVSGPYLALLGASGAAVGIAAGAGESLGYGLRLVFGYLSDRTRRYWAFTIAGYALSALVVPALALAGSWRLAVVLLTLERVSKALRSPAKDTLPRMPPPRSATARASGSTRCSTRSAPWPHRCCWLP